MPELVVEAVPSAGVLQRALSPGAADEYGDVDGDRLTVDDDETAEMLVETYPNVDWADQYAPGPEPRPESDTPRAEIDADGVTYHEDGDEDADENDDWDEDEWLGGDYRDRADMVRTGAVDAYLEDIEACETSQTVLDEVDARRDALGGGD